MPEDSRPVGETRDAIIAAIAAGRLDTWKSTPPTPGVATVPTSRLIRVITARLMGRTSSTTDG